MKKILLFTSAILLGLTSAFAGKQAEGVVLQRHSSVVCHSLAYADAPTEETNEFLKAELDLAIPESIDGKHSSVLERRLIYRIFGYEDVASWEKAIERYNNTSFNPKFFALCKEVDTDRSGMNVYVKSEKLDSATRVGNLCSFKLNSFLYTGGAHGDSHMEYVNYDCNADKIVLFSALLTNRKAVKNMILKAIAKHLGYSNVAQLCSERGVNAAEFKVPNNFYMDSDHVIFVFNTYELGGCFAEGKSEVKVKKQLLKPYLTTYGKKILME